jgi:hypothetical protein
MENVAFRHVNSNTEVGLVAIKDYVLIKKYLMRYVVPKISKSVL